MHELLEASKGYFESWGVWGLFWLAFIEAFFLLPPPDALLIPMALATRNAALAYAAVCTLGSALGGGVGYAIGFFGGRPILDRFFKTRASAKLDQMFLRYGVWAILISAFTPLPYKIFTIGAGVFKMPPVPFFVASLVGRGTRFFLEGILILYLGEYILKHFNVITIVISLILILGVVIYYWWRQRRKDISQSQQIQNLQPDELSRD